MGTLALEEVGSREPLPRGAKVVGGKSRGQLAGDFCFRGPTCSRGPNGSSPGAPLALHVGPHLAPGAPWS